MNYQKMKLEDIIKWCKEHNQVEWLKATAAKKVTVKRYTEYIDKLDTKTGTVVKKLNKNGAYVELEAPISFIELKKAFVTKFMPEIAPKAKPKKKTMYELIAEL